MTSVVEIIRPKMLELWNGPRLSPEERAVLGVLWHGWNDNKKITQQQIADSEPFLGCHPRHEAEVVPRKRESTLRQVRQLVRNLRVDHGVPVLSDRVGYWIPRTMEEAVEYVERMEKVARAQTESWHQTYRAVRSTLNVTSSFFDALS